MTSYPTQYMSLHFQTISHPTSTHFTSFLFPSLPTAPVSIPSLITTTTQPHPYTPSISNTSLPPSHHLPHQLDLCVKILGDILDVLFSSEVGPTYEDITQLSSALLEDIIAFVSKLNSEDPLLSKLVSVLVSLLRQMNERHFQTLFNQLTPQPVSPTASPPNTAQLCCFLLSLMDVLESLVKERIFPKDWAEMILLQNSVIVKVLQQISRVISERVREPFKEEVWGHFFHTSINFITQPSLQLEGFTPSKRNKVLSRYKDMRKETALEIKSLWFSLGSQKIKFVKGGGDLCMVGPFLKMTMLPGVELRKATIPIFFDMMQCEFYSSRDSSSSQSSSSNTQSDQPRTKYKFKFNEFESEMLEKLDELVESGHGDGHYREMFQELVGALCCEHNTMKEPGLKLVRTVTRLLERLLQYRTIMNTPDNSAETRMSCIVNLLDFYAEIKRKELYLRYVYKLSNLHLDCDNYTESGYTLKLHADLLHWTNDPLSTALRSPLYPKVNQHGVLKEMLYGQIIDHFDKGKMWEDALVLCKELVEQYEVVMMDYNKLADLLARMSNFYRSIMNPQNLRPEPEYFRVAYFGRGFPAFLQNKVFVYRGNGFERLADFTSRILDQFPNAERMTKLTPPSDDVKDSPQQFVQISKVDCAPEEDTRFLAPSVNEQIQKYYRAHHVKVFTYSRPFHRGHRDPNNEFATLCIEKTTLQTSYPLPGILRCFPVVHTKSVELSPLENAIESMTTANNDLYEIAKRYARDLTLPLHQLTRKVSGMVDAAVMGGVVNYEKAFLTSEYECCHAEDADKLGNLRQLIANQAPLLEAALFIHGRRVTEAEMGLHNHMVTSFNKMQAQIQDKYGIGEMPEDLRVEKLRLQSQISLPEEHSTRGSYHYSSNDSLFVDEGGREEGRHDRSRHSLSRGFLALTSLSTELAQLGITLSGSQHSLSRLSAASGKAGCGGTLPRQFKTSTVYGNGTTSSSKSAKKESRALKNLLRRESFSSRESSTQWFQRCESVPPQPIVELTEQVTAPLTPQRPKRLDSVDMLPVRPRSCTFTSPPTTPSPSLGSRESLGNTPTGSVYEEDAPPPLPIKARDQDNDLRHSSTIPMSKGIPSFPLDLPTDEPPKKPPRPDKNHNHQDPTLL
ncbi:hypothetical protein Pmani_029209 [Petrolisthes manimaculis]|uniref:DOCKER domain-containing protein n=1 Tax=Petrolisthes manimaculis TaxID=1843537 RepID=A0AAE1NY16_9EUCA|nr:hypothetical protein Pmani_029209 [Petrolisthes manimaculis]